MLCVVLQTQLNQFSNNFLSVVVLLQPATDHVAYWGFLFCTGNAVWAKASRRLFAV